VSELIKKAHLFDGHFCFHHDALVARVLRIVVAEGRPFQRHWLRRRRLVWREAQNVRTPTHVPEEIIKRNRKLHKSLIFFRRLMIFHKIYGRNTCLLEHL
jgi:hypothetical protein